MSTYSALKNGRVSSEHFVPSNEGDHKDQSKLRGALERIDYTAFAANCEVLSTEIGPTSVQKFERIALFAARARAAWVKAVLASTEGGKKLTQDQIAELAQSRMAYEELTAAYDAMRRMVERGYLTYAT